ncbi:MAG: hypothetical protein KDA89_14605 [Planctomycetaceae bacterium]|nr:hypothetical protein [Planctomycetaceae bacterium]
MSVLTLLLGLLVADDPVFSGPQPGEDLSPFTVNGVFGDAANRPLDVLKASGDRPVVLVFVHERTRPAFGVANVVMRLAEHYGTERITGGLVFLTNDPTETQNWMNRIPQYFPRKVLIGISPDGPEGPGSYGLNRNVALTILVSGSSSKTSADGQGVRKTVRANFALIQPSLEADAPKIFRAVADVLGEQDVPAVTQIAAMGQRDRKMTDQPAAAGGPSPELRSLLRPMLDKSADDAAVAAAAQKIEQFAAKNPDAQKQLGEIARRIIAADRLSSYGTSACQAVLKRWAEEFQPDSDAGSGTETPQQREP